MANELSKWPWRAWLLTATTSATAGIAVAACTEHESSCAAICGQDVNCPAVQDAATDGDASSLGDGAKPDGAPTDAHASTDADASSDIDAADASDAHVTTDGAADAADAADGG